MTPTEELARRLSELERRLDASERTALQPAGVTERAAVKTTPIPQAAAWAPGSIAAYQVGDDPSEFTRMRVVGYHGVVSLNADGEFAVDTGCINGVVSVVMTPGDVSNGVTVGGAYDWDTSGPGGTIRAWFRVADWQMNWLGAGAYRVNVIAVGW